MDHELTNPPFPRADDDLPPAVWRALARNFGAALDQLRETESFQSLDAGQWAVLVHVLSALLRGDANPGQAALAARSGYCVRAVRGHLVTLRGLGMLGAAPSPKALSVGPVLSAFLRELASSRDPKNFGWSGAAPGAGVAGAPAPHAGDAARPAAPHAGGHADAAPHAGEGVGQAAPRAGLVAPIARIEPDHRSFTPAALPLLKKNKEKDLHSSFLEGGPTGSREPPSLDAATSRRLALDALAIRFLRANPGVPLPRGCDASDVKLVEACVANERWDAATQAQMHKDAIDGAFDRAPPDRPPTPMYIWGQLRFFLENARAGRAKRLKGTVPVPKDAVSHAPVAGRGAPEPRSPRRSSSPTEPVASHAWVAAHLRETLAAFAR